MSEQRSSSDQYSPSRKLTGENQFALDALGPFLQQLPGRRVAEIGRLAEAKHELVRAALRWKR